MSPPRSRPGDGARLSAVIEEIVPLLRSISNDQQISASAASLLSLLDKTGKARISELSRAQCISQPGMTQLVRRLTAEGLVSRTEDHQSRATWVEIAPAGRRALAERRTQRAIGLTARLDLLDPKDRSAITAALPALERMLERWDLNASGP